MNIQNRLLRIFYSDNEIICSDVKGRLHKFDVELNLICSSPALGFNKPINAVVLHSDYIFTKDRFGTVGKWDRSTLEPIDFYQAENLCDREKLFEDEEPSPSPNRAIAILNNRLYTNNGYGQIVVIDIHNFSLLDIRESPSSSFFDAICVENAGIHALSDVEGNVYIGNIEENSFPIKRKLDNNVIHGVIYDEKHDRFCTTQDGGLGDDECVHTGIISIDKDGENIKEFKISHEDNEFICFSHDYEKIFIGGFNGKISVFDNSEKDFKLEKVFGPLEFQIIHASVDEKNNIYALLQTGDIFKLDLNGKIVNRTHFSNKCIWILEPHPNDEHCLYAGTDAGVAIFSWENGKFDSIQLHQRTHHRHGFGIVKDVKPLNDGSYIGISRKGDFFRCTQEGHIMWIKKVHGVPRGLAVNCQQSRCMLSSDAHVVYEFDVKTGDLLDTININGPSYACAYTKEGLRIFTCDFHQQIIFMPGDSQKILGSIKLESRLKRLITDKHGHLFVTGPGGVFEIDTVNMAVKSEAGEFLVSTKETCVYCNDYIFAGGYGYQVGVYQYSDGEIVDLEENLPDYTKAFAAFPGDDEEVILFVGGRGGFINTYRVRSGKLHKIRETYVS
ncbi:WD40 repeat domain-containing protein [Pectobacterium sp. A5351]|uniref:WD40 repeat domain-containing protein n=1 Tax=Pectobacterium sp. A5351 TaxID=2914983 RepID=UPI002331235F|nr:WD40 repeat domain-containing protein [Pectobacterium sp. A5351]WCG82315.1 WD40 repeat domain-containing protein [Pectobacterium sp. A5351]